MKTGAITKRVLVTGAAGFVGSKVSQFLLEQDYEVVGIDNLNSYYDVQLKKWRLQELLKQNNFVFYKHDMIDLPALRGIFSVQQPEAVINLAAQVGVRYSLENPFAYVETNVNGTLNLLELCREYGVQKLIMASTSSLYAGHEIPFDEESPVNTPLSPYAASKKAAEALAYSYHYLYDLDVTITRYFTVYGPAGRPDMSVFQFLFNIIKGRPLQIFGDGSQKRDFTYIDDIARGTIAALNLKGFEIINLGNNSPERLDRVIKLAEEYLGKRACLKRQPFHKADMMDTCADIRKAERLLGWKPEISLEEGLKRTTQWMQSNWEWITGLHL